MKKLIFPILALGLLGSCAGGDRSANIPGHLITGEIANAEGSEIIVNVFQNGEEIPLDTIIIKDGKFSLETETKELREYIFLMGEQEMPIVLFLDEESKNVEISGTYPKLAENYTVTGSKYSQDIKDYLVYLKPIYEKQQELSGKYQKTNPMDTVAIQGIMSEFDVLTADKKAHAIKYIEADYSSPVSWLMLRDLLPSGGLNDFNASDLDYFQKVADAIRKKYPYSEYSALIEKDIQQINSQLELIRTQENQVGQAPDIQLNNANGDLLALSSLKGKVVLVDFWASWCVPCRKENPNVVAVYNQYKDKGFTVYSVSLDEKKEAWLAAIQQDNLIWPNHVSDLKGWQSAAALQYGVNSIPATFLLDAEGNIIAKDLRGPALEQKLKEILG